MHNLACLGYLSMKDGCFCHKICSQYRESTSDTWKAEGEPFIQHVAASDQPWPDCVALLPQVLLMLAQPPNQNSTFLSQTQPLNEDNRAHHWAEKPTLSPCEKALRNGHSALPCENSNRTVSLPGWNLEISGAASHPYAQCLWRNDSKFFLQEQDTRNDSFPQIGALRETIHKQIKAIFLK